MEVSQPLHKGRLEQLDKQLWLLAIMVITVLSLGLVLFMFPTAFMGRPATEASTPAARLAQVLADDWAYTLKEFPEFATFVGAPGENHRWTDYSLEAIERRKQRSKQTLERLRSVDRAQLDAPGRLNYDLFGKQVERDIEGNRFPGEWMPITQLGGVQQDVAQVIAYMPAFKVEDYENILARLRGSPALIDQSIELMEKGLAEGVTPPQIALRNVPQQIKNQIVSDPVRSPLLRPFQQFSDQVSEADRERLLEEAKTAYTGRVAPAYQKLHDFFIEEYLPASRETIAMSALLNGKAWYAHRVRYYTTTNLSPAQIYKIGLGEVKRIRAGMERVRKEAGFEGSWDEFNEYLRTDPQFFYTEKKDLLIGYRDVAKRADAGLVKLFGTLPRLPYAVVPVPSYAEKSQTTAYYLPGSAAGGRPGQFFANTYNLEARPTWEMEALTLHEAVPGHHLQIALAQELEGLPEFRKHTRFTAFVEGWGLYAESLGEEMGFYADPYSKFGQLNYEMWRAIRLVVDTGMHALGWSRQQAIDFFRNNTGRAEHDITVEVDRYIVWPGQALAYKIGELKIKELRAFARKELGENFDIRAFHDQVLGAGALPLDLLESRIKNWVAEQKKKATASPTP